MGSGGIDKASPVEEIKTRKVLIIETTRSQHMHGP
jgi:hypothetical protein